MNTSDQLNKCYSLLKSYDTAVIATASSLAEPHASVVNYFMNNSLDIFFIARQDAQKFRNINENHLTCLVVCTSHFESSVEVKGRAFQLEDSPKVNDLLGRFAAAIKRKNAGPLPIMREPGSELYLFQMIPHMLTYADFNLPTNDDGEYFEVYLRNESSVNTQQSF
jgi:nitroimidazol reductase NimA-like FMN-containing flavoprotein (pyridoxamine 5'-phosphate oxidase superfamily)